MYSNVGRKGEGTHLEAHPEMRHGAAPDVSNC